MVEMKDWSERVLKVVGPQGPKPMEYAAVTLAFNWVVRWVPNYREMIRRLVIEPHEAWVKQHERHGDKHGRPFFNTLLHVWHQPHGYAGDGDLLTKLYRMLDTPLMDGDGEPVNPWVFSGWDAYISSLPETLSLQSRKEFVTEMARYCADHGATSWLDVACGVGEFTKEVYMLEGDRITNVHGIDNDSMSISVAKNRDSHRFVTYHEGNVLRGLPPGQFDAVYCAGMFDYLDDDLFVRMGKRLLTLQPTHVMIGNMDKDHPSCGVMDCLGWELFDRSRFELLALGERISSDVTWTVDTDRTGLQHFLRGRV